jgi:hypothetical protein
MIPEKKDPKRHLSYEGRYRLETTVWDKCNYDQKNHVYITSGSTLIGYVALYGPDAYKEVRFGTPLRQWSVSRRKFRDLTKKEIALLKLGKHLHTLENGVLG